MTTKRTNGTATSRRDSLRLLAVALAAPMLLPRTAQAQDGGTKAAPAREPVASASGAGGPWPSAEKLLQTNAENVALLKKVRLANGDAPDQLPRPPVPGAQRKGARR